MIVMVGFYWLVGIAFLYWLIAYCERQLEQIHAADEDDDEIQRLARCATKDLLDIYSLFEGPVGKVTFAITALAWPYMAFRMWLIH